MIRPHCIFCEANQGVTNPATVLAAQSTDRGKTITWVTICDDHADGWNDGGDWMAPMFLISPRPWLRSLGHRVAGAPDTDG